MAYDTLEEAQARILELDDEVANLKTEKDALSQDKEKLKKDNDSLRTLNQKYFNKLIAQDSKEEEEEEEEDDKVPTCEEFAHTLLKGGF